jgi:hypothetical protein
MHFTERCLQLILSESLFTFYEAVNRIVTCKKPHTRRRNLIVAATIDIVTAVLGEASVKRLSSICLSNDTVCYQIAGIGRI